MNEILNDIGKHNLPLICLETYNLDVTKLVDDNFRHTCLYYAAQIKDHQEYIIPSLIPNSSYEIMKMFIEKGVPATYTDILNQTALYYVAMEGKIDATSLLLQHGISSHLIHPSKAAKQHTKTTTAKVHSITQQGITPINQKTPHS